MPGTPQTPHRVRWRCDLIERGATTAERAFLRDRTNPRRGQRVELNALVGRTFLDWLEAKLEDAGVAKVIPDDERLEAAFRRAVERQTINEAIHAAAADAKREAKAIDVPDDLAEQVAHVLDEDPDQSWMT